MGTDTGGKAYPSRELIRTLRDIGESAPEATECLDLGMTLLDWFAGQALMAFGHRNISADLTDAQYALLAYDKAAAMVAEKRRRESDGDD